MSTGGVTFGVYQGPTLVGAAASASVSKGVAQVSYTLPPATPPGTYSIHAAYTDAGGTFAASSDDSHTLTVAPIPPTPAPGYFEVAAGGGVFSFGTARFSGSMSGRLLSAPVVGMAA